MDKRPPIPVDRLSLGLEQKALVQAPTLAICIVFLGTYLLDSSHNLRDDSNILKAVCNFT